MDLSSKSAARTTEITSSEKIKFNIDGLIGKGNNNTHSNSGKFKKYFLFPFSISFNLNCHCNGQHINN